MKLATAAALSVLLASAQRLPPRRGNTFELPGGGSLEFSSPSSFRYARTWGAPLTPHPRLSGEEIEVAIEETSGRIRLKTHYVNVDLDQDGGGFWVRNLDNKLLLRTVVRRQDDATLLESLAAPSARFYGLGDRRTARLDLRRLKLTSSNAFLISSSGFGEYLPACGGCVFDLAASRADRWTVTVPGERLQLFFFYGPTPKEILEEHNTALGPIRQWTARDFAARQPLHGPVAGSWATLREALYGMEHASLSAELMPEFDLAAFEGAGPQVLARATQLAAVAPVVYASKSPEGRARWLPHLVSYAMEARDRGIPILRPMPMQFHDEPAAAARADQIMFGDEVLLAPVLDAGAPVSVYLPRGIWTDLRTNEVHQGRQEITVQAAPDAMPAFARNGTILPLATGGGGIELHYFPKLGAEYFLYEEGAKDISQFHAAPAGDLVRLEVESKADRDYEWVVHNLGPCREVSGPDIVSWRHDKATNNIHVKMRGRAGAGQVIHIAF